jgi:hypothetical protein
MTNRDNSTPTEAASSDATPNRDRKRDPVVIDATALESKDASSGMPGDREASDTARPDATETVHAANEAAPSGEISAGETVLEPEPAPPPAEPKRSAGLPLLAGLLLGAAMAVGGSAAWQWYSGAENAGAVTALSGRTQTLEEKLAALDRRTANPVDPAALAALDNRLKAIEQRPAPAAPAAPPANTGVSAESLAALDRRITAAEAAAKNAQTAADAARTTAAQRPAPANGAQPVAPPPAPPVDLSPVQENIAKLDARLAALEKGLSATRDNLANVEKTVAAPKVEARATETRVEPTLSTAGVAALGVVAQSLVRALDRGAPFAMEVTALKSLGIEAATLAPLEPVAQKGVQTPATLSASFAPLIAQIAATDRDPREDGVLDRLTRSATSLVKIRPVDETSGDTATAIASRIKAALKRGDLAAAFSAWASLPEAAKKISAAWAASLDQRLKAEKAAFAIQADAISRLAQSKN